MTKFKLFAKGISTGFHEFGKTVSAVINAFLLTVVYIVGVGITSIIAKIFGKKFFDNRISERKTTYWSNTDLKNKKKGDYYKQF